MIAKIVKGSGFREVTGYIIDSKKNARIIAHAGLFIEDVATITKAFEAQAGMNPKVSRPVGHIALGFSKEDESRLTSRIMAEIALEYMERMGIRDTQFFIAKHFDKEHPHIHIAYNRIDNDGRTISDKNERLRSARICKELIAGLNEKGVDVRLKYKGKSDEVQGVVFIMNGYSFSGSKIDRQFSYSKIDAALKTPSHLETKRQVAVQSEPAYQQESHGNELYSGSLGLFTPNPQPEQPEGYPDDYLRKKKKKKQRKIRW